ncbi:MAG: radical SAM protein [Dehalococcoidia bacterium]|nr:radical SAM protein [Dehalococcoidia bacterium]
MRKVLLINANTVRPPVSPIGLEYAGQALLAAGVPVEVADLAFVRDWKATLATAARGDLIAVGVAVRNTDDCCFATGRTFLPWIAGIVSELRRLTGAPIVLGGVGYSTAPESVLSATAADYGISGEAEVALPLLCRGLAEGDDVTAIPGLVHRSGDKVRCNPRKPVDLALLPLPRRRIVDNPRYEREGAMVGVETKRGCDRSCIFCADPVAKGNRVRLRPPQVVVDEFADLLEQGVTWYHLCDAEFNIDLQHAKDVCRALINRGLGGRLRWYTYCAPSPFDDELAGLMTRAGCAGINFGVDSLDDGQLRRLGSKHRLADVETLVSIMKEHRFNYIFDLLLGGPGETQATVRATLEAVRRLEVPLAGAAIGVRVYRGTPLWRSVETGRQRSGLRGSPDSVSEPLFYVSPRLGDDPMAMVADMVAGDPGFLFLGKPSAKDSYNYAGDDVLARAIADGERGAYWDILRRLRQRKVP